MELLKLYRPLSCFAISEPLSGQFSANLYYLFSLSLFPSGLLVLTKRVPYFKITFAVLVGNSVINFFSFSGCKVSPAPQKFSLSFSLSNAFSLSLPHHSLGVPDKPQISGFENPVPEGDKVTLTCTSTGSKPPARLRWYRGDQEVEGETQELWMSFLCVCVCVCPGGMQG